MTELVIWVFFALVQAEGMQMYGFKDQFDCHAKMEEVRQAAEQNDILVMSRACLQLKLVKP